VIEVGSEAFATVTRNATRRPASTRSSSPIRARSLPSRRRPRFRRHDLPRLPRAAAPSRAAIAWLRARGVRVPATAPAAATPYSEASYDRPAAVVVGSERHGPPVEWLCAADEQIAIPMPGPVDSLNVAVAAGVVLCEAMRARRA
jgi:hypothetical protein